VICWLYKGFRRFMPNETNNFYLTILSCLWVFCCYIKVSAVMVVSITDLYFLSGNKWFAGCIKVSAFVVISHVEQTTGVSVFYLLKYFFRSMLPKWGKNEGKLHTGCLGNQRNTDSQTFIECISVYRWATHPLIKPSYQTFEFCASGAAKKLAGGEIAW
jgi:hypothetical protein